MPVRALNLYYARDEGTRAQVLATRLRATDVRQEIGIPRGRVFVRADDDGDLPDVMWDCPFADANAHDQDMRARAASADFEACRAVMRAITRRFERVLYDETMVGARDVGLAEHMMQVWLASSELPDIDALRSAGATAALHRSDDNARLPDWIVELAGNGIDERAIDTWIARHANVKATRVRWQRRG